MKPIFLIPMFLMTLACNPIVSNDEELFREKGFEYTNEPTSHSYTDAIDSGFGTLKPYPNPDDVCAVVDKASLPTELAAKYGQLIACPKHEKGALGDRIREGAIVVAHAKHWTVLRVSKTPKPKKKQQTIKAKKSRIRRLFPMMIFMGPKLNIAIPKVGHGWFILTTDRFCQVVGN